jgi:putative peptidoglycan lipid II flippase
VLLAYLLHRRGHFSLPRADWGRHGLIIGCSVVMGLALWGLAIPMAPFFTAHAHLVVQLIALGVLCTIGFVLYFALVHITGAQPMGMLLKRLRRAG